VSGVAELPTDLLAGNCEDVALWVASLLEGRYRFIPDHGMNGVWLRSCGRRWVECDRNLPARVIEHELEHAYYRLLDDHRLTARQLQRLVTKTWVEGSVLPSVRLLLAMAKRQQEAVA